jgi:DNA polymerase III subunit epsilon
VKVCYLDVETTGTDPKVHGIHQIAMILSEQGRDCEELSYRPRLYGTEMIVPEALAVSGVTLDEISSVERPPAIEILAAIKRDLERWVDKFDTNDKFTVVAYNARFDMEFLKAFFERGGEKYFGSYFNWQMVDPLQLCYWLKYVGIIDLPNYKLATVCEHFGVKLEQAHDAMADIRATAELADILTRSLQVVRGTL